MIPAKFDFVRAGSADEAVSLLAEHGDDAKLIAGGHSLLPLMKLRLATPAVLVDVARIGELSYIRESSDHVAVGALTRHREVETSPVLAEHVPVLRHAASLVGDPQVRHRGTLGGSLAHGDPASDLPAVALALDAEIIVRGPAGERSIVATDFFTDFFETALAPDEMVVEIRFPKMHGAGWSYQKFNRRAQDWAIVGCAVVHGPPSHVALVIWVRRPSRNRGRAGARRRRRGRRRCRPRRRQHRTDHRPERRRRIRRHLARVLVGRGLAEAASTQ